LYPFAPGLYPFAPGLYPFAPGLYAFAFQDDISLLADLIKYATKRNMVLPSNCRNYRLCLVLTKNSTERKRIQKGAPLIDILTSYPGGQMKEDK